MTKLKVSVTQEDIDHGQAGGRKCPVALALTRATGRNVGVALSYFGFYEVEIKAFGPAIPLPEEVTKFIHAFDETRMPSRIKPETTEGLKPFEFEVDLPEASANAEIKPE